MRYNYVRKIISFSLVFFLSAIIILPTYTAHAFYEGVRDQSWDPGAKRCNVKGLKFNPLEPNDDFGFEPTNAVCGSFLAVAGYKMLTAGFKTKADCLPTPANYKGMANLTPEQVDELILTPELSWPTPVTAVGLITRAKRCATRAVELASYTAECATPGGNASCGYTAMASADMSRCCASVTSWVVNVGLAVSALAITHSVAQGAFDEARICGHDWHVWHQVDDDGNEISTGDKWKRGAFSGSYQRCLNDLFNGGTPCANMTDSSLTVQNKLYREYIYGGREFKDSGDSTCSNPRTWSNEDRLRILGYTDRTQRYYMNGPDNASNFACHRFLTTDLTDAGARDAYDCCVEKSQNTVCIQSIATFDGKKVVGADYEHKFCRVGERCNVGNVWYDAYQSKKGASHICAKTYSVCPYNHLLGGGTEKAKYDAQGNTKNFCQVMNHCTKVPIKPYVRTSGLDGEFISGACRDLRGDTQNHYSYNSGILPINNRNFSAPMAQCFKETMENMFLHRAGHSKCIDATENPDANGDCAGGNLYKTGDPIQGQSFFLKVQQNLKSAIKLALTISIIALGFTVLLGMSPLTKKQLLSYIVKISLVMYFAVGDGWQFGFMNGVMGISGSLGEMVYKVDESGPANSLDGCQFPRYAEGPQSNVLSYPAGKGYLRIWDTLDCKLARAIGYGPTLSPPNLILMILGGFATGGLGVLFLVGALTFAFCLFSIVVRSLHIFILSLTAIIILLYVSPITITLAMFGRTKSIFDNWWKQLLGFILQPVILFAYLAVFISFFDNVLIGSATFSGGGNNGPKEIVCNSAAEKDSLYCIFKIGKMKNYTGLEAIGIGYPILTNMTKAKLNTIIQSAFLMFIFLAFLDKITSFAKELVGGSGLSSDWKVSTGGTAAATYKALKGVQKRGGRGMIQAARKARDKIGEKGNRGKSPKPKSGE